VNKSELIEVVAESADLPKAAAGRAIDAMMVPRSKLRPRRYQASKRARL